VQFSSCLSHANATKEDFRSVAPTPNEWIENEFQAFARGDVSLLSPDFHAQQVWANDFQRLDIGPRPFGPQQQQPQQPQPNWGLEFTQRLQQRQQQEAGPEPNWESEFTQRLQQQQQQQEVGPQPNWGLEFTQRLQQQQEVGRVTQLQQQQQQQQQPQSYTPATTTSYPAYTPAFTPALSSQLELGIGGMGMGMGLQQPETTAAAKFQFDESAFEKAFADAAQEVESREPEVAFETVTPAVEKGKEKEPFGQDSDALARTAGQLLDSVRQDTSTKFQNSNFLALMRKLRDHEVVVEGDKMVETARS